MNPHPIHVKGFLRELKKRNSYMEISEIGEFQYLYEVICNCKNKIFSVYKNSIPSLKVICTKCKKEIELYDLHYYPAASALEIEEEMKEFVSSEGDKEFNIAIYYEYSDEFELEDPEFNEIDITWCTIYGYGLTSKQIFMILNDETA